MKLGVLFSGGKDSTYAMLKAMKDNEVVCLISILSKNPESYMFHTPNINLTKIQAEAIGLPLLQKETEGIKEEELDDLKAAIQEAKDKFQIEGIVTGAVASRYQADRIQKICDDLKLECINPLWGINQEQLLREVIENKLRTIIIGIFAYPLTEKWLGKEIDEEIISELVELQKKYEINPAGEGGEIETLVVDAPFFKKKLEIVDSKIDAEGNAGTLIISNARLEEK